MSFLPWAGVLRPGWRVLEDVEILGTERFKMAYDPALYASTGSIGDPMDLYGQPTCVREIVVGLKGGRRGKRVGTWETGGCD